MDGDTARNLFQEGGILIVLDMPTGSEFGMDYHSWTVGPKFQGVKMIPPGLHFVSYRSAGPRSGFFLFVEKQQIVVKRWDSTREILADVALTPEDTDRYRAGLKELDPNLGAYQFDDTFKTWLALTSYIRPTDLARLQPRNGVITSVPESDPMPPGTTVDTVVDSCRPSAEAAINFTPIPKTLVPPAATPAMVTKCSMDKTFLLDTLLRTVYQNDYKGLLAEIQFAFVCFLVGQVFEAFEQWKAMVHLVCSCDDALGSHPRLYMDLMGVLHYQLRETPRDFFVDIMSRDNFLTVCLQSLFSRIDHASNIDPALARRAASFKASVTKHFNWSFENEVPDDEQPVVVEDDVPEDERPMIVELPDEDRPAATKD